MLFCHNSRLFARALDFSSYTSSAALVMLSPVDACRYAC